MEYGFCDRLTKDFPSQVNVDLIERCNYACIHCPYAMLSQKEQMTAARFTKELNQKLVDEVRQYGTQQIRYTANGEPFLHPDVMDILGYAVKNSGSFVTITTNGSLVDSEKAERLLKLGIGLIDFSLDAYKEETYQAIRVHGHLEKVREHINCMLKKKAEGNYQTRIVVSFVVQEKNRDEREDFEQYWKAQGVDYVIFRKLHSAAGEMYQSDKRQHIQPCVYPWERISIDAKGQLQYCPNSWGENMNFNFNYADHSIHEIWSSKTYKALREEHLANTFKRFKRCESCPDRAQTIWPFQRTETWKGYGDMIQEFTKGK